MGNLPLTTGFFRTETMSEQVSEGRIVARRITGSITYYYVPLSGEGDGTSCPAKDVSPIPSTLPSSLPLSETTSDSQILSDSPSDTPDSSHDHPHCAPASRPLLVFFAWLGAPLGAVAKYRDLYLDRGMDVLVVQSSVMHFLWPRWGLDYGLKVLKVLEEPQFSGRPLLVHASSIGGYTFTQLLTHVVQGEKENTCLAQRVIGHIYDSLVFGTLEHMAIGLAKTLVPRFEGFVKNAAMFYFWLFKSHTADLYNSSIQVFHNSPIAAPALFFSSENDALCDQAVMEKCIDHWRRRGVTVDSRTWKESTHAAHMRCHPEDYLSALQKYLKSLHIPSLKA